MNKIFTLPFLFVFVLCSCEKIIDVNVPSVEPKLVVDATFEVFFNENPVTADTEVKLTLTSDFFDENIRGVTDATVSLKDLSDNSVINYINTT